MITQKINGTRKQASTELRGCLPTYFLKYYTRDFKSKVYILESVSKASIREDNLCKPDERLEIFFQKGKKKPAQKKPWAVARDPAASSSQFWFLNSPWQMLVKQDLRCH